MAKEANKCENVNTVFQGLTTFFVFSILICFLVVSIQLDNFITHINDHKGTVHEVAVTVERIQNLTHTLTAENNSPIHRLMGTLSAFPTRDVLNEVKQWRIGFGPEMHKTFEHGQDILKMIQENPQWLPMIANSFVELANAFNNVPFNEMLQQVNDLKSETTNVVGKLRSVFQT